jgi:hypothetical protein
MKVFIFSSTLLLLGFGYCLCHALTEFSDLLSLAFCCVVLMCCFVQKSGICFGTKWPKKTLWFTYYLFAVCLLNDIVEGSC